MIESTFTLIFIITVFIIGIRVKSILYTNEHIQSIENELTLFDDNFNAIEIIDKVPNFKLGSGHLYE